MFKRFAIGLLFLPLCAAPWALREAWAQTKERAAKQGARAPARPVYEERFDKADVNKDNRLSRAEAAKGHTPRIRRYFGEMDANKDGHVTLAERNEFVRKNEKRIARDLEKTKLQAERKQKGK